MNISSKQLVIFILIAVIAVAISVLFFLPGSSDSTHSETATPVPNPEASASKPTAQEPKTRSIPIFNLETADITDAQKQSVKQIGQALIDGNSRLSTEVIAQKNAAGAPVLLNFNRIKHDADLKESTKILTQMRQAIRDYYDHTAALFQSIQQDMSKTDLSDDTQTWILLGMKNGLDAINLTSSGDLMVLDQAELIIKLLSAKDGSWTAENGKVTFTDPADQEKFDSYLTQIQKIKADQAKLIAPKVQNYRAIVTSLGVGNPDNK